MVAVSITCHGLSWPRQRATRRGAPAGRQPAPERARRVVPQLGPNPEHTGTRVERTQQKISPYLSVPTGMYPSLAPTSSLSTVYMAASPTQARMLLHLRRAGARAPGRGQSSIGLTQ